MFMPSSDLRTPGPEPDLDGRPTDAPLRRPAGPRTTFDFFVVFVDV